MKSTIHRPRVARGRPSKAERERARTLHASGTPVETIAERLNRDPALVASWSSEHAKASAHAAATGAPPPPPPPTSGSAADTGKQAPSSSTAPSSPLTAEAVVGTFEVIRACVLEGACVAARIDSSDARIASKLELPQRHRDLLTFCAPVLVPAFSRWLQNETAALAIAGGVMIASTLPVVLAIRALGRELKRDRDAAARAKKEAELVVERNGAGGTTG